MAMWQYISLGIFGFASIGMFILRRIFRGKVIYCYCTTRHKKTIIITGANSGIGKATALELSKKKCCLILACKDIVSGEKTRLEIIEQTGNRDILVRPLDLTSVASIRQFAASLPTDQRIDVLVNNAGIFAGHLRNIPDFGTEEDMAVNHLGHALLTICLLPRLSTGSEHGGVNARVVIVSSSLAKHGSIDPDKIDFSAAKYSPRQAYANSKLANCLFARELHRRYHESQGLNVYTLETAGMVNTNLIRHSLQKLPFLLRPFARLLAWRLLKNPLEGCQTVVHCAISEDLDQESGQLYANCEPISWRKPALENNLAGRLWEKSLESWSSKS